MIETQILHENERYIIAYKPPGMHVHQPEFPRRRVDPEKVMLVHLRRRLKQRIYPVHRLDVATEGLLVVALSGEAAGDINRSWESSPPEKIYFAIVRGYTPSHQVISTPLSLDSTGDMVAAETEIWTLSQVEIPMPVGKRYPTARYSLIRARITSGRWHQIRRHLRDIGHPIIGDREHGDSYHNRFFREHLNLPGLWLFSKELHFAGQSHVMDWTQRWANAFHTLPTLRPNIHFLRNDLASI